MSITINLNNVQTKLYRSITVIPSATLTGTATETELLKVTIPANTLSANELLDLVFTTIRSANNTGITLRFKMSTSATMPSGTTNQIGQSVHSINQPWHKARRKIKIYGGNLMVLGATNTFTNDDGLSSFSLTSVAFDSTVVNYFYISATLGNTADSIYLLDCSIRN